jgi:hypothetical protein
MKNFDPLLSRQITKDTVGIFYLLELYLGTGGATKYYYTNNDKPIYYNGHKYNSLDFKVSDISFSSELNVDEVELEIGNQNRVFSGILLNEDVRNKVTILSFGCTIQDDDMTYILDDSYSLFGEVSSIILDSTGGMSSTLLLPSSSVDSILLPSSTDKLLLSGSVDTSGSIIKLSLVDGNAFVDFNLANYLTPYLNGKIIIIDNNGKSIVGYIKAAGTEETYGPELLTNGTFDTNITGWHDHSYLGSISWNAAGKMNLNCNSGIAMAFQDTDPNVIKKSLYRQLVTIASIPSPGVFTTPGLGGDVDSYRTIAGSYTDYFTANYGIGTIYPNYRLNLTSTPGTAVVDDISLKEVLTPSDTGVTIVSSPGGSIYNWESIESGFNYNGDSYTFFIEDVSPYALEVKKGVYSQIVDDGSFTGIIGEYEIQGDKLIKLTLNSELILWNKKALRNHAATCQWTFKGSECGYGGSGTCDLSYDSCVALGNQNYFGGFRFLPAIEEKDIWWGRTQGAT